eukprot:snap_masked-scaffold_14-processed-gene-2.41-mRNA-1 protein AED:0.40 eAED:0.45 QI:0/-1/0/1/-1/1/1/0/334
MYHIDEIGVEKGTTILAARLDPYGKKLATGLSTGIVNIYEISQNMEEGSGSHELLASLQLHTGPVLSLDWANPRHGLTLASSGSDGIINITTYNNSNFETVCSVPTDSPINAVSFWKGPSLTSKEAWFSSIHLLLAGVSADGKLWAIRSDQESYFASSTQVSSFELNSLTFDDENCQIFASASNGRIYSLTVEEGEGWVAKTSGVHGDANACVAVNSIEFRPVLIRALQKNKEFCTCGDDGQVLLWKVDDVAGKAYSAVIFNDAEATELVGLSFNDTGLKLAVTKATGETFILKDTGTDDKWILAEMEVPEEHEEATQEGFETVDRNEAQPISA